MHQGSVPKPFRSGLPAGAGRAQSSLSSSTDRNASCEISTFPTCFIRFLPSFCFSKKLPFSRDIAAVALGRHVLAEGRNALAGDHPAADRRLDRHLELMALDFALELFDQLATAAIGMRRGGRWTRVHPLAGRRPGYRAGTRSPAR